MQTKKSQDLNKNGNSTSQNLSNQSKKQTKSQKKPLFPLRQSASMILFQNQHNLTQQNSQITLNPSQYNFKNKKILMFKRKSNMSFANLVVFPGGACDKEDIEWSKKILNDDSFQTYSKISAIRELFEETGILLLPTNQKQNIVRIRNMWKNDKTNFNYEFFCNLWKGNLNKMIPLIRLLTVQLLPGKRFDTIFYTPDQSVIRINMKNILDDTKIHNLSDLLLSSQGQNYFWQQTDQILQKYMQKQIQLIPPQLIILNCFKKIKQFSELQKLDKFAPYEPILMYAQDLKSLKLIGDYEYNFNQILQKQPASKPKQILQKWIELNKNNKTLKIINEHNKETQSKKVHTQQVKFHSKQLQAKRMRRISIENKSGSVNFLSNYIQESLLKFLLSNQQTQRPKL